MVNIPLDQLAKVFGGVGGGNQNGERPERRQAVNPKPAG